MSDQPISIIIVEDEPEFRRRFVQIIENEPSMKLVGVGANKREAQAIIDRESFDVMLIDLGLPDGSGIDLIRETKARHQNAEILVITVFADRERVLQSLRAGASGYLLKSDLPRQSGRLIETIAAGGSPLSPAIARYLIEEMQSTPARGVLDRATGGLSEREHEILRLCAKGLRYAEIADVLALSTHTINSHLKSIYRKLTVNSRAEAVYEARRMGLLDD